MPDLEYNIEADADLSDLDRVVDGIENMGDELDDLAKSTDKVADAAEDAEEEMGRLGKAGNALKGLGNIGGIIAGGLGAVTGIIGTAVAATQNWVLKVEDLSNKFSIGLDDASALATSWARAGVEAETGEAAILGFQGRLIDELEAQKEAAKEVEAIHKERADVLEEMSEAEADHLETLAELEAHRAEISDKGIKERRAKQQEELAGLRKDYNRFLEDQRAAEVKENEEFEEIWEERTRIFEQKSEQLRNELSEKSRSARNVREFLAAQDEFSKKQKLLNDELTDEKSKHQSAHEKRIADLKSATDREKELYNERSMAINEAADKDVAKMEAANAKALANLEERIAAEKEAFGDRTEGFNEQLASLSESEAAAQEAGAGLQFVMNELGVKLTDAEGNIRPVDELMWDMKEALNGMEDGARKAAIISDLGWEDLATWIERGAGATESMNFAQSNNLTVTEDQIEAIHRQNELLADLQLKMLGVALEAGAAEAPFNLMTWALEKVTAAGEIAAGLWDQLKTILGLLWDKGQEEGWFDGLISAFDQVKEWIDEAGEVWDQLMTIFGTEGGAAALGKNLLGAIPGFQTGTRSVPGTGPQLAMVHGGEEIRPRAEVLQDNAGGRGGRGGDVTVNISGSIYGVSDLETAIANAIRKADMSPIASGA